MPTSVSARLFSDSGNGWSLVKSVSFSRSKQRLSSEEDPAKMNLVPDVGGKRLILGPKDRSKVFLLKLRSGVGPQPVYW